MKKEKPSIILGMIATGPDPYFHCQGETILDTGRGIIWVAVRHRLHGEKTESESYSQCEWSENIASQSTIFFFLSKIPVE